MSIQQQLEKVSTRTTEKLIQFKVSKQQHTVLKLVARTWGISVSELFRRSVNLVLGSIKDRALLARIDGINKTGKIGEDQ